MNRAYSSPFSFSRLFKFREPAAVDIEDLEKSFHDSSFAPLPSAATPSRLPSNTIVASSRVPLFGTIALIHIPYGRDKWPEIVDWYNEQVNKGSTAISKLQLRKDHQQPYFHEYIVISTRGGHTYRVDRRPDADAPFDTIMMEGCTAYDTIEGVKSHSLKELDRTSDCVVELHWQGEQTIDLLFVLSVCFRIRNDPWAKRYTLQHYNCYFLSWTIIMIIVRNTTAWGDGLNEALGRGVWAGNGNWKDRDVLLDLDLELRLIQERNREQRQGQFRLFVELELELAKELELELELAKERELEWLLGLELELELELEPEGEGVREWDWDWDWGLGQRLGQQIVHALVRTQVVERKLEQFLQPVLHGGYAEMQAWSLKWALERVWHREWKRIQVLPQMLPQMPLVLGWALAQAWKNQKADVREELRGLLQAAYTVFLPGELAKTVPRKQAEIVNHLSIWSDIGHHRSRWQSKTASMVMILMMEDGSGDMCGTLSNLAYFPSSFSVSLKTNVSFH
jgi:hypothetical protein